MKTALVTGATKGIGKATAITFAKNGYSVAINYRSNKDLALEVLEECNKYSEGNVIVKTDVSQELEVKRMIDEIKASFDTLTVVVNNAGIYDPSDSYQSVEAFENIYRNNFLGCIHVVKYATKIMSEGSVVNISSIHGRLGHGRPGAIAYSAFKAALENYTKNLAKELAPSIRVNAIAPGRVSTPMWGTTRTDEENKELGKAHAIQRMIEPEEIADAIVFLINNKAMCGEVLTVDGGMSLVTLG